jgi:acetylornithine deacetylase/succinyl-diaminopimelate desuccinylase-like protein
MEVSGSNGEEVEYEGGVEVEDLYTRRSGGNKPHLKFADHTDVVPPGDKSF